MVALIWIACFLGLAIVQVLIKYQVITLGAIPTMILFGLTWWLARTLASKWKKRQAVKKAQDENKTATNGEDIYYDPSIRINYRDAEPEETAKETASALTLSDALDDDTEQEGDGKMPSLSKVIAICALLIFILLVLMTLLSKK
jgi:TRAP-type uncharacterized transport system fused permease subunit